LGIIKYREGKMPRKRKKKLKQTDTITISNADVNPFVKEEHRKEHKRQGKTFFLDEFHTLYRRWFKNE
jgi:hypothetical protein